MICDFAHHATGRNLRYAKNVSSEAKGKEELRSSAKKTVRIDLSTSFLLKLAI
jgi:hypothetical protein